MRGRWGTARDQFDVHVDDEYDHPTDVHLHDA